MEARTTPTPTTVLITGGTLGIGRACVLASVAHGAGVVTTWQSGERAADELADIGGDQLRLVRGDATDAGQVEDAVTEASAAGCPEVLVNNVGGVLRRAPALDLDPGQWDSVLALNLRSTYLFTRALLPGMRARGSGAIVNVSALSAVNDGGGNGCLAEDHQDAARALAGPSENRLAGLELDPRHDGALFLRGSPLSLSATVVEDLLAGDHKLVLCRVNEVRTRDDVAPLVFHRSTMHRLQLR